MAAVILGNVPDFASKQGFYVIRQQGYNQGNRIMKFFKETTDNAKHQAEQAAVTLD
jgi:methylase of polypeptide subunit release factors